MTVTPQATPTPQAGTAMTVIGQGKAGNHGPPRTGRFSPTPTVDFPDRITHSPSSNHAPARSGDLQVDSYTLWAYSDVFKGLVLDIRL